MFDANRGIDFGNHRLGKLLNRPRPIAADVEDLALSRRSLHQAHDRRDHFSNMREAAYLTAVVVDHDRSAAQRLIDKSRNHHAVVPDLPRPDDIEESADHHRQSVLAVVRQREELVDGLRATVGPARTRRRAQLQIVFFGPLLFGVLAVHLAGRSQEKCFASALHRQLKQHVCRIDVRFDGPHRIVGHQFDSDGGGEVINDLGITDDFRHQQLVGDRTRSNHQSRMPFQAFQIFSPSRRQVVEHRNVMPRLQQFFGQMTPDESRSTRHQTSRHELSFSDGRLASSAMPAHRGRCCNDEGKLAEPPKL